MPQFERTADNHLAARVGSSVYAMLPSRSGYRIGVAWTSRDVSTCRAEDFSFLDSVANENEFRDEVDAFLLHEQEKKALNRKALNFSRSTPWGAAQDATRYGEGVVSVSTAGHGGFLLSASQNQLIHEAWRDDGGAYEEDSMWAVVAHTFPDLFTTRERALADKSLRNWLPDAYMTVTGTQLGPDDSHILAERAFKAANTGRYIVVSAIAIDKDTVSCHATINGNRRNLDSAPEFLVPRDEYAARPRFGFVIDEERHPRK